MREVNFSIPNVNKASVGITTALYDRRALDCTSTLPLINSLNHLAYLTTSSARIRDILTIDGGIERLICILKQGRSQEMMEMWKWNLAFQCVVNIGVRGSESVRTRVVEADMVPVIATILENYIRVIDKCREKAEVDPNGRRKTIHTSQLRQESPNGHLRRHGSRHTFQHRDFASDSTTPFRRQDPPPAIEIPPPFLRVNSDQQAHNQSQSSESTPVEPIAHLPLLATTSPTDSGPESRNLQHLGHHHHHHHHYHHRHHHHHHHHYHRSQDLRPNQVATGGVGGTRHISMQSLPGGVPTMDIGEIGGRRAGAESDRPLTIVPPLQAGITSQPESPTTPGAPSIQSVLQGALHGRTPSILQPAASADGEDTNVDEAGSEASVPNDNNDDSMIDIQTTVEFDEGNGQDTIIDDVSMTGTLHQASEGGEADTFNIAHPSANDGSIINPNLSPQTNVVMGLPQATQPIAVLNMMAQNVTPASHSRFLLDRTAPPGIRAAMPRDEDVLMSLQLLAYVSKYCNLRSYFQQSHLVPRLRIKAEPGFWDDQVLGAEARSSTAKEDEEQSDEDDDDNVEDSLEDEEYLLPDDFNIFPLVEKFTVKHHSHDMQHWAGVVMRNLCRKDDAKGGIRQCAYYECGRWEQYTRQFAKCRRCRRTKYCSKECQKNAWIFHRHWCQVAN